MEVIQGKHKEYDIETITKATVPISYELEIILEDCFDVEFNREYRTADFYSSTVFDIIIKNKSDYDELSEEDFKDIEDIIELLGKVNFVTVEVAL